MAVLIILTCIVVSMALFFECKLVLPAMRVAMSEGIDNSFTRYPKSVFVSIWILFICMLPAVTYMYLNPKSKRRMRSRITENIFKTN